MGGWGEEEGTGETANNASRDSRRLTLCHTRENALLAVRRLTGGDLDHRNGPRHRLLRPQGRRRADSQDSDGRRHVAVQRLGSVRRHYGLGQYAARSMQ